jgi:hypothetical protein
MQIKTFAGVGQQPNGIATGIDWKRADFASDTGRKAIADAITGYFGDVRTAQKTVLPGQVPTLPRATDFDLRLHGAVIDGGDVALFTEVDRRGSANPVYTYRDHDTDAIVFTQKTAGEPAGLSQLKSGTAATIGVAEWHGALGIDDTAKRFDEYGEFEMAVQAVPSVYQRKVTEVCATLINAVTGITETWATDLTTTVNNAAAQILEDCGDFYGVGDAPQFVLRYNPRNQARVAQMLAATYAAPNDSNSGSQLVFSNLVLHPTRRQTTGSMKLILPGHDMKRVVWDDLYSEYGRDYMRGADAFVWRSRWNAAIGNTAQLRSFTLA